MGTPGQDMKTLIRFKTMADILLKDGGTFDHHGNLQVRGETLAPVYFQNLGQLQEVPSHHAFKAWMIEKEYRDDAFGPHQALRFIAEKSTDDFAREIAEEGLRGKASIVIGISIDGKRIHHERKVA